MSTSGLRPQLTFELPAHVAKQQAVWPATVVRFGPVLDRSDCIGEGLTCLRLGSAIGQRETMLPKSFENPVPRARVGQVGERCSNAVYELCPGADGLVVVFSDRPPLCPF